MITTGEPRGISNVAWHAVLKKDRHYDGKFLYAAVTTRIYCRPSCPARNPHRRNALIFLTVAEAERQGYVACLRCHPNSLTPAEKSIKVTLDYIEAHTRPDDYPQYAVIGFWTKPSPLAADL